MKNIHVLPTDKASRLYSWEDKLTLGTLATTPFNKNIYITSDEEIKTGDWYINTFVSEREQKPQTHTEKGQLINHKKDYRFKYCEKIILTDNQDLIKDGIQLIDDDFLEWFVKNPSCEEVRIELKGLRFDNKLGYLDRVEIIIPKEEPKQFKGRGMLHYSGKIIGGELKQETLEELKKRFANDESNKNIGLNYQDGIYYGIEVGAKWQQERSYTENQMDDAYDKGFKDAFERMYTEQEVLHLLDTLWDRLDLWYNKGMEDDETEFNLKEWFDECELKKK